MKNLIILLVVAGVLYWLGVQQGWWSAPEVDKKPLTEELLVDAVAGELVASDGTPVKDSYIAEKPLVLIYFSAHWCPPCRTFTPRLVSYYNKNRKPWNFAVIFVSSDRSEAEMYDYMREANMPWAAVKYRGAAHKALEQAYAGRGIPCLVLVDEKGKILADSFDGDKYLGPDVALEELTKRLAELPKPKMGRTADDPNYSYDPETDTETRSELAPEPDDATETEAATDKVEEEPEAKFGVFKEDPNDLFKVQMTMESNGQWKAMVNSKLVNVGDELDGDTKVIEIGRGLVVIERFEKQYDLWQE
jgi:nucleoredoxin